MTRAFIGIGSNLGKRRDNLAEALERLGGLETTRLLRESHVIETCPEGGPLQGTFLNMVVEVETEQTPHALLEGLLEIEKAMGRIRGERWGPRIIDLDLLLYGEEVIADDRLTVPHPLMHRRWFVLEPLCEIAPNVVHTVLGVEAQDLLTELENGDEEL